MTMFEGFSPIVAVLAFDGVVLGDLALPCEVFGRAGYRVRVCSEMPTVETRHAQLLPPWRLASVRKAHTVVVPGVESLDTPVSEALLRAVRSASRRGARIASVCTGAFVLARTGLLEGLRVTTHWRAAEQLAQRHPSLEVDPDVLYVDHGTLLTSAGAAAAFDLCLHMVRCDLGAEAAATVARNIVMPLERAGGQAQFIDHPPPSAEAGSLSAALSWFEQNLHRPLTLQTMARRAGMSPRTLSRRFREQVGATPAKWLARARVRRAQGLLETTQRSVEEVAAASGFTSAAVLRENFARVAGTTPQAYRRAFGQKPTEP